MSKYLKTVIANEPTAGGRDPWFDRPFDRLAVLSKIEGHTTLSKAEGESRRYKRYQYILDPGRDDRL